MHRYMHKSIYLSLYLSLSSLSLSPSLSLHIYIIYILYIYILYIYIYIYVYTYIYIYLFSISVFVHVAFTIHRTAGERGGAFLIPLYHFHLLHECLHISQAITAESSPLHITCGQTKAGKL